MSELYELPGGWEWKRLDDCADLITKGTTPTTYGYKFLDNGINFLKIENIINGEINLNSISKFISEEANQSQKRSILQNNDVLFSIAGTIGDTAIVKEEHLPMNTNQAIAIIRPKKLLDSQFLKHSLLSVVSHSTKKKQRGGAIKNISLGDIKNTDIPLPPLQEQKRIVAKLNTLFEKIDKAIALHQKNMDEADVFMGGVLNEVFGELEEKYGNTKISEVLKISNKTLVPSDDEEYHYVGLENIESNSGKLIDFSPTIGSEIKSSKVVFKSGMVLYGKLRPYLNKVWISNFDGVATTEILPFYPIDNHSLNMNYVKHYFLSPKYLAKVMNNCSGARMPRLTTKFIKSDEAYIPLPLLQTQQKTVKYLDQISEKTEILKRVQNDEMESLKALKASILDKAFRGEL